MFPANASLYFLSFQVCSGLAYVLRVVILRKKRIDCVQAMVEFASVQDAQRIKDHLQGQDIYDHCCTMSIEYAYERVFKLKVSLFQNSNCHLFEQYLGKA